MLKNYLKTAWRNMKRNKLTSFINIGGMALGMGVAMIIGLWMWNELSFDKNFPHYKRISQVMLTGTFSGEISTDPVCPVPLADELRNGVASDLERVVLTTREESHILGYEDKKLNSSGIYAEDGFEDMFSLIPLAGSMDNLNDPTSILLSETLTKSLFGDKDPIGKLVKFDAKDNLKVVGVYADFPLNSSLSGLNYVASFNYYQAADPSLSQRWNNCYFYIYVQLKERIRHEEVSKKIAGLMKAHLTDIDPILLLHPMQKWHLFETFKNGVNTGGQIQYVWMFGLIGVFVMLLACINFMNLSTAKSERRAKEVGILKAIGSGKRQLVTRFLVESIGTSAFAFILSLLLVAASLPWFNQLMGMAIKIVIDNTFFWLICLAFVLLTGIIAGCYPAFYLSSFQPVKVLKGSFKAGRTASAPRKVLVVMQFFTSIFLIIATVIVLQQLNHARNRPLGYTEDRLIQLALNTPDLQQRYAVLRNELLLSGAAEDMAISSSPINQLSLSNGGYAWEGKAPNTEAIFGTVAVTADFGHTAQWNFLEGRDFSRDFTTDSSAVIINEMAARYMGITHPVGKELIYHGQSFHVVGVIQDPMMGSPFATAAPTAFFLGGPNMEKVSNRLSMRFITIRLTTALSTKEALEKVQSIFARYNPESPFDYSFVDQQYAKRFRSVETTGTLASIFATLAIFISCLGLYALATFVAEQRHREIGIRKVLGASELGLWRMVSQEFIVLTGIAFIVASPIAYWCMELWLTNYVYRITISWEVFALTGLAVLLIAVFTVSFQTIKAAMANPVESLRDE